MQLWRLQNRLLKCILILYYTVKHFKAQGLLFFYLRELLVGSKKNENTKTSEMSNHMYTENHCRNINVCKKPMQPSDFCIA